MASVALLRKIDWPLFSIITALVGMGLLTIYGIGPNARSFFYREIIFFSAGIAIMFAMASVDYRVFKNITSIVLVLYGIAVFLLLTVLQLGTIRAVRSWIVVHGLRIEPAEVAKLAVLILLAKYFSQKNVEIHRISHVVVSFIYAATPAFLTFIQPDLGSAVIFILVWFTLLLVSGARRRHIIGIIILALLFGAIAWLAVLQPYQKARLTSFLDPLDDPKGAGYSVIQSRIAIGSGGWYGMGLGKGTQARSGFLPEAHTDFIFASFAEQFGLAGGSVILVLFLSLVWRISYICQRAGNNFAKLFGIGFISLFGAHVILNIGINLGLLPVTGIPLSFVSYGGSHLAMLMIGVGIIQSIKVHSSYGN